MTEPSRPHDYSPRTRRRKKGVTAAGVVVALVIVVLLHVTGVVPH
jgi:hypothetical protein